MTQRFGSASDFLVEVCLHLQMEFRELDAEKILKMPSTRFDLLVEKYVSLKEEEQKKMSRWLQR